MKKLVFILFILLIMAFTNPTEAEYIHWLEEKAKNESSGPIEKGLTYLFGKEAIESSTTSANFIFFSIYKTEVDDQTLTFVGAFNHFFHIRGL